MKTGPIYNAGEFANVLRGFVGDTPLEKPMIVVLGDDVIRVEGVAGEWLVEAGEGGGSR